MRDRLVTIAFMLAMRTVLDWIEAIGLCLMRLFLIDCIVIMVSDFIMLLTSMEASLIIFQCSMYALFAIIFMMIITVQASIIFEDEDVYDGSDIIVIR